jgi:hypothetical protein
MRDVAITVGQDVLRYAIDGETAFGPDEVLLEKDTNVIEDAPWQKEGYVVADFLAPRDFQQLRDAVRLLLFELVAKHERALRLAPGDFRLEDYHRHVATDESHLAFAMSIREGFGLDRLGIDVSEVERRVSELCRREVVCHNPDRTIQEFCVRIVRPGADGDNNPPHRDVWLDRLRNAVNIYLPLAGSNERSALPIVPGSHTWRESEIERTTEKGTVNGAAYRVPAVVGAKRRFAMVRPNPGLNQVMVFSPYAIHGGGRNFNQDVTRVSVEMRFWPK